MRSLRAIGAGILAFAAAIGAFAWLMSGASDGNPKDALDSDFVAVIRETGDPLNFIVEVKKVNPDVDKELSGFWPVQVGLAPVDASGRSLVKHGNDAATFVSVLDGFDESTSSPDGVSGRVRLIRRDLRTGTYSLKPYVRIYETGKDAQRGGYTDGGSVHVAAGNSARLELKPPWEVRPLTDPDDVVDDDFEARLEPTPAPDVFLVEVKRVNMRADKVINTHHAVHADLDLVDSKGRHLLPDFQIQTFAKNVGDELGANDEQPYPSLRVGRIRLVTTNLPSGSYVVRPNVRIVEEGKDRMENPRATAGSVRVKAANSLRITVH